MKLKPNDKEQQSLMVELVRYLGPKVYVELGISRGATFNLIAPLVEEAYGADKILPLPVDQYGQAKKKTLVSNMSTEEFAQWWTGHDDPRRIDLLFIDADHSKKSVLADFDVMSPFVKEGTGIIILHDTHPSMEELAEPEFCGDAYRAAWEIRKNPKYVGFEIVTLPSPAEVSVGFSIIRKSMRQLSWKEDQDPIKTFEEHLAEGLKKALTEERGREGAAKKEARPYLYESHKPKKTYKKKAEDAD